jgi:hypothetical protein
MKKEIKDYFQYGFAALFIIGSFILFYDLSQNVNENNAVALGVVEILKMSVVLILGYFFGSSKGSADKNDIIGK